MILVVGLTEAPPFLLIVEEPETILHPAAQRALLGLFQSWATDRQIVAATHSTVMLDWTPGGERLWLITRLGGVSEVTSIGEDRLALLHSLGVRPSDIMSAERVIIVEGPTDEDILGTWFPDLLRNPRVAILHGGGGDSARHASKLAEWLTSAERLGLRQVMYIRDRDELAPEVIKGLLDSPTVHILERREIENYLLAPEALAAVIRARARTGDSQPSSAEVEQVLIDAARSLRNAIIVNRVTRQIAPARPFMDNDLRHRLAGASAEDIIAAVQGRLMTIPELREQVVRFWEQASVDVMERSDADLLKIAPGKDVLDAVFMRFRGTHYKGRSDGTAIAKAMSPPEEITDLVQRFLSD